MRSPFVLLALTLATASPSRHGTVPADHAPPRFEMAADSVSVPMHLQSGRVLLDVKVNGQGPFRFILDTGAQGSVFDLAFAQELELPLGDSTQVASPGGRGLVARRATIDRLEIGGLMVHGATGAAMAGLPFPPGADSPRGVLSPYRLGELLVTLDYPKGCVVFRRGALPEPDGREIFGWDRNGELPLVPIDVAGHPLRVHLDSGASGGLSLPVALENELPLSTPVTEIGRARTVDRELVVRGAKLAGTVTLGRYKLEAPNVTFIDVLKDVGNVGPAILKQFAITLDPANARLRLAGPANGQLRAGEERPRRYGIAFAGIDATPLEVAGVDPGAPADKAGLRAGDRILRMNGQAVDSLAAERRVQALQGSPLRLEVLRGDKKIAIEMRLE